jgi:hypothetical protein
MLQRRLVDLLGAEAVPYPDTSGQIWRHRREHPQDRRAARRKPVIAFEAGVRRMLGIERWRDAPA